MASSRKRQAQAGLKRDFDPSRWAHLIFVLGGFMGAYVLSNAILDIWELVWAQWPQSVPRQDELQSSYAGIAIAAIATLYAWRRKDWFQFCTEVVTEISQVTWPTRAETRAATIVVVVMTLISSTILWGMDRLWSTITNWLYGI
jgi:preprotein translocase subunit SecE